MDNYGAGKEEILLEVAVQMEAETEELKDLPVGIFCKKHEEPGKRRSTACILLGRANNGTTFEGGRGAIEKRTAQIQKRTVRWLATKVSMMGAVDNGAGSRQQSRERRNNQPLMGAELLRRAVAGNNESERTAASNDSNRGQQPEKGLPWPKMSDRGIRGGRGILDLDDKYACG